MTYERKLPGGFVEVAICEDQFRHPDGPLAGRWYVARMRAQSPHTQDERHERRRDPVEVYMAVEAWLARVEREMAQ